MEAKSTSRSLNKENCEIVSIVQPIEFHESLDSPLLKHNKAENLREPIKGWEK